LHYHMDTLDRVQVGAAVKEGDPLGHPSCEGGRATGDHLHIARKYNGEWLPADGNIPFFLSGWVAHQGDRPYIGTMTRGEHVAIASVYSSPSNYISR